MTPSLILLANHSADARRLTLELVDVPAAQVVSGHPRVGSAVLGYLGDVAVGVWEMTPGVSTDVEVHEFFVVLAGKATGDVDDGSPALELRPGSVGHLAAGATTTWTITETLRKIYLA